MAGGNRGTAGLGGGRGNLPPRPEPQTEPQSRRQKTARTPLGNTRGRAHAPSRSLLRRLHDYDREMAIQKAAVRMPVSRSIRRRDYLRTPTMLPPMAQSRKPNS